MVLNFQNNEYLEYSYDTISNKFLFNDYNPPSLRKLGTAWVLSKYHNFIKDDDLKKKFKILIMRGISYILKYKVEDDNYIYIKSNNNSIAYNAFLILTMININYKNKNLFLKKLGDAISQQIISGNNKGAFK